MIERILRGAAGFFVLLSILLLANGGGTDLSQPSWLWFTAFVGLNLLQSAFTNWCPLMAILRTGGQGKSCCAGASRTKGV